MTIVDGQPRLADQMRGDEMMEERMVTPQGRPAVKLRLKRPTLDAANRRRLLEALRDHASAKAKAGAMAAGSPDELYDEHGLP